MAQFHYAVGNRLFPVRTESKGNQFQITVEDAEHLVGLHRQTAHTLEFTVDGRVVRAYVVTANDADTKIIWIDGRVWTVAKSDPQRRSARASGSQADGSLIASTPAQVRQILVSTGEKVVAGDPLLLLEAMKMEMRVSAPMDGIVAEIQCAEGDMVTRGQILAVIKPA